MGFGATEQKQIFQQKSIANAIECVNVNNKLGSTQTQTQTHTRTRTHNDFYIHVCMCVRTYVACLWSPVWDVVGFNLNGFRLRFFHKFAMQFFTLHIRCSFLLLREITFVASAKLQENAKNSACSEYFDSITL